VTGYVDPTKEAFAAFRADDRPGSIHMLNLVKLRARAAYPDGREATGAEAYAAYGRESGPVFSRLGGSIVWRGRFEHMLIGPVEERWNLCFIAQYPSVDAFVAMIRIPVTAKRSSTGRRPWRTRGLSASRPARSGSASAKDECHRNGVPLAGGLGLG
jgi:hypothetical protein